ncbi:MAG TPA: hypothetical protein DCO83_12710 [Mucilaginibacter sp.]|nr:hypothetical protein [Mucilaginibacter sp.]
MFFPFAVLAQSGVISGVVTSADSKKTLPRASVFLSNSAVGSATNEEGRFMLSGIRPGQYTLVVSILGFEQYTKTILVGREPVKLDIELTPKPLMLREVVISSSADWKKNYEAFRKEFIGSDENAKECTIINPHVLNLTYNPTKQVLHADADEFLVVENKALGYRVKFLLNDFNIDHISNIVSREWKQVFEELPGNEAQKKKWHEKREAAYYGSAMHFLRSLYADKLADEGFQIYHLRRSINPMRPDDQVIRQKLVWFRDHHMVDSGNYYIGLAKMSKYHSESLVKPPLFTFEVLMRDEQQGLFDIHFQNYLYVVYTKKTDDVYNKDLYRPIDMPNYAVSVLTLSTPYAIFDMNGIFVANAPLVEGTWAMDRFSELLPVDYVPDQK